MPKVQVWIQTRRERRKRRGRGCCRECKTRWQVDLSDPDPTFDETIKHGKVFKSLRSYQ